MTVRESTEGRWLSPDKLGGDITNPQSLNRYAYVTNNPASFNDPSGLSEINIGGGIGGFCDPFFDGNCEGPLPPSGFFLPVIPVVSFPHAGSGSGGAVGPATSAPPAGQPPLAGGGVGASCGPLGCYGGLQFQEPLPIPPSIVEELINAGLGWLLENLPEAMAYARWCLQNHICSATTYKLTLSTIRKGGGATLNDMFGCADAPCIQKALENIQQQQENGTWEPNAIAPSTQPRVTTVTPNPKRIVPAGAH